METREEQLARWADPARIDGRQSLRVLRGSFSCPTGGASAGRTHISEAQIQLDQLEDGLIDTPGKAVRDGDGDGPKRWHFRVLSVPRLLPGRLALSLPRQAFEALQESWKLHPRTVEVFLSNNGVFTTFRCPTTRRLSLILKVASSRSTGFDSVSVTFDPSRRTTYVLYHHLKDEDAVFAALLAAPERCLDPHAFVAALYRSHHYQIEIHRSSIDDAVLSIERQTGYGQPGRIMDPGRRRSVDKPPAFEDAKTIIQKLSFCQTDLAIIRHAAQCCLGCGDWLVQSIRDRDSCPVGRPPNPFLDSLSAAQSMVCEDVEYMRRRTAMLLSQVQQMTDRTQSQTAFSDSEYTAAIAIDTKRDSIAMRTISILGIIYLPGSFVATLFSMDMFQWGDQSSPPKASPFLWVYWAVALPLTLATVLIWFFWVRRENYNSSKRLTLHRVTAPKDDARAAASGVFRFKPGERMV
ncbi:hypothetical protein MGYG_01629 [Nannizzia gypsea CBS 118893]|uniref:CorA family metal ion transporter n=1 Tax=Arthroderma gypseum (strain ATCC MYA-4604 / CBS 118893) TaxID=535722 RepID=E5R241_ARTGP|nr:hypothetical protein MGYG_01629 [Nannizzia gypsea CBS 118893]EFQ98605.1 hypothetical protein MGYG_01629 [Nannizzia gypsea CBS 118893]